MIARTLCLTGVLTVSALGLNYVSRPETPPPRRPFASFPAVIERWTSSDDWPLDAKVMAVLRVDDYLNRTYQRGTAEAVGFYIGYFRSQRVGQTIHSPMVCLPGGGWQPERTERLRIQVTGDRGIEVNRLIVQKGAQHRQMVLYWYQTGVRTVASDYMAKAYKFVDAVRYNRTDGALVRVIAPIGTEPDGERHAEALLVEFVQRAFPLLAPHIPS